MKILWFRRDLRTHDNPLLSYGGEVMPIFIFDSNILKDLPSSDKRVSFIYEQVQNLKTNLRKLGLDLYIFYGDPVEIFSRLKKCNPAEVIASIDYDAYALRRDTLVAKMLPFTKIQDSFIFGGDEVVKADGSPYLVFTPYFNKAKALYTPQHALCYDIKPHRLYPYKCTLLTLESLGFQKVAHNVQTPQKLFTQLQSKLHLYKQNRDYLNLDATSHLSVHLRFGTISIREVLRFLTACKKEGLQTYDFFRQLVFRDFYAYLLYHFPKLENSDYKNLVAYEQNDTYFQAFINAKTGIPIVDASITELLTTGNMHNRARMITASFFTKHLLLPWQKGEAFFAARLLDFEKSSNVLSWQWAAGTGIDPQPYFRIFNPYMQSKTYDKEASYIKKWLPQLQNIASKNLHNEDFLSANEIKNYPRPIVMHKFARARALGARI
jgi:deoxyribodipyrimidine photo-lyase